MKVLKASLILLGTLLTGALVGGFVLAFLASVFGKGGGSGEWAGLAVLGGFIVGAAGGGLLGLVGGIVWVVKINQPNK